MLKKQSELLHGSNWSTLVILDACRFDYFDKAISDSNFKGELRAVDSEAGNTTQWYLGQWVGSYPSVTLISASPVPWSNRTNPKSCFEKTNIKDNFKEAYLVGGDLVGDSDKFRWIEPEKAFKAIEKVEVKTEKLLVHLVPPHLPYLHQEGKDFLERIEIPDNPAFRGAIYKRLRDWAMEEGSWIEIEKYYLNNIKYVLNSLESNISLLEEPIVLSSDHSELIGERDFYGHPPLKRWLAHPIQTIVPWFKIEDVTE